MQQQTAFRLIFVSLIILAVAMRFLLFFIGQFTDEDTMTAVLMIKLAIPYLHPVQDYLSVYHSYFSEQGIVWFGLIIYELIGQYVGLLTSLYIVEIAFAIAGGILVYKFAEKLAGKNAGLFAMLLYAVSPAGIFTNAINVWKGEEFFTVSFLARILVFLYILDGIRMGKRVYYLCALSFLCFALFLFAFLVWNGGAYAIAAFGFLLYSMAVWQLLKDKTKFFVAVLVSAALLVLMASLWGLFPSFTGTLLAANKINYPQNVLYMTTEVDTFVSWLYYPQLVLGMFLYLAMAIFALYRLDSSKKNSISLTSLTLYAILCLGLPFAFATSDFDELTYLPLLIFAGVGSEIVWKKGIGWRAIWTTAVVIYALITVVQMTPLILGQYYPVTYPYQYVLAWIAHNTTSNSIFLTLPEYGTPIEYYANRTVILDANIAPNVQNATSAFSLFLGEPKGNFSYLSSSKYKPEYLVLNTSWILVGAPTDYNFSSNNLALFDSAPYSILAENISMGLVYHRYGYAIYEINYNVPGFGSNTIAVCRSVLCAK